MARQGEKEYTEKTMEYNYTAIILRKRKIGETDRLYTMYTREAGKVQSIGRGIRRPQAKLAGHMETLNQSSVIVARRHGLGNIAGAITERYFGGVKSDAFVLRLAIGMIGIFDRLIDTEEKDERLFDLLQAYLMTLDILVQERKSERATLITHAFAFQLLDCLGYRAHTHSCALSGEPLSSDARYAFSPDAGGVVDARLAHLATRAVPLSVNAIKLIRLFLQNRLETIARVRVSDEDERSVGEAAQSFLHWVER